jgi:hypothetical protein
MPRSAKISSTSRRLRLNTWYSQTAWLMISAGNGSGGGFMPSVLLAARPTAKSGYRDNASRKDRSRILDKFEAMTGLHRKHAMRLLRCRVRGEHSGPRLRRRVYDDAVREALILVWEASDRVCGKRLRPLTLFSLSQWSGTVISNSQRR